MSTLRRRVFLAQLAVTACAARLASSCNRPATREDVLRALVEDNALPGTRDVVQESQALQAKVDAFAAAASEATLRAACDQWKRTLLAWKRAYAFRNGPIVESNALLRTTFWPPRPAAIDDLLSESRAFDDKRLEELGVDRKGLYAMEHLLFDPGADGAAPLARFTGPGAERARGLLVALARNVRSYADAAAERLGDGADYAKTFAGAGQDSLNTLVNQMIASVETIAVQRLLLVYELHQNGRLKAHEVEAWPSKISHEVPLAILSSTERLYLGAGSPGIGALVSPLSEPVHQKVRAAFAKCVGSVRALGAPLEQVVLEQPSALQAAAGAARELELALKVDLASLLGVTLTFTGGDGD